MRLWLLVLACLPFTAAAADLEYIVTIHGHRFDPSELRVPAGKKIKLIIHNQDASAEEFESHELNREKVVPGNSSANVFVGPLAPGRYPFFGDFNEKTANGVIVAE